MERQSREVKPEIVALRKRRDSVELADGPSAEIIPQLPLTSTESLPIPDSRRRGDSDASASTIDIESSSSYLFFDLSLKAPHASG